MANDHSPVNQNNINAEYGSIISRCGVCGRSIVSNDPRLCPECASFILRAVSQAMDENDQFQVLDSDPDKARYQIYSLIKKYMDSEINEKGEQTGLLTDLEEQMEGLDNDEPGDSHSIGDSILCTALERLGYCNIVEAFSRLTKWYE